MSMNSFSFRAAQNAHKESENEISQLLELHPEGEAFAVEPIQMLQEISYHPVNYSKLKSQWKDPQGRRRAPRFEVTLTVLIANHCKAFRTQTQNVSATGLLLKDLLPDEFSKHFFDVVLIHTSESGKRSFCVLRGRAIATRLRTRQVQFEALNGDSENKLQEIFQGLQPAG